MTVEELISLFSTDTQYTIKNCNNNDIVWWGRGNRKTNICDKDEVYSIQDTKKGIVIYINYNYTSI